MPVRIPHQSLRKLLLLEALFVTVSFASLATSLAAQQAPQLTPPRREQAAKEKKDTSVWSRMARGEVPPSRGRAHIAPDPSKVQRLPQLGKQELPGKPLKPGVKQIGVVRLLDGAPDPLRQAARFEAPEGEVLVMGFASEGALRVRLRLTHVDLPPGAKLYAYSASNPEDMYGPYEGRGPFGDGEFWTPPMEGESVVLEYVRPPAQPGPAQPAAAGQSYAPFRVVSLSHTYGKSDPVEPQADWCHLNVTPAWQSTANAVAAYDFIRDDALEVECSGTLLTTQAGDLTPYLLTANHCVSTETVARTMRFRWFYDAPGQSLSARPHSDVATLLSTRDDTVGSDYTLLMILGSLPDGLTWAGWTTTVPLPFNPVVGVHHPNTNKKDNEAYKRISFGGITTVLNCPSELPTCNNFLPVDWTIGVTEHSSSGSGLWTDNPASPLLVGQLWGGNSLCDNPSGIDLYGRFSLTFPHIANFLAAGADDALEHNDSRASARPVAAGTNAAGQVVKSLDEDWYRITVPAGNRVTVSADFEHDYGDIDVQLYRASDSSPVTVSNSLGDSERVEHTNTAGAADYFVRVFLFRSTRNTYGLRVSVVNTQPARVQFSAASYSASEGAGAANINLTRAGDTSVPVSVGYMTVDNPAAVRCDAPGNIAYARCDYATTVDVLTFAPGETTKVFTVPLVNDAHAESSEVVTLRLVGVFGGVLGTPAAATLTITDNNDTGATANPISNSTFFLRAQYLDFLSREPEPSGLQAWLNVLNTCPDVNNNPACDRVTVSSAFFGSAEFQLKGGYVYRFYKVAFNRLPTYDEITPDMRAVTGLTPAEVFAKKAIFANSFAQRADFTSAYAGHSNSAYVSSLLGRYGLGFIITPDPFAPDGPLKLVLTAADLIVLLDARVLTRAQVLRAVADSDQVSFIEFNSSFVAMQYFGYLRRDPEPTGFNNWLNYLNRNPTDFRTMVNGFVNSQEYRLRFGRP